MNEILDYYGYNPYLLYLKNQSPREMNDFELEYVNQNFKYSGYKFNDLKLKVGQQNVAYLNEQFGTNKEFSEITIDYLWGETKEVYHFGYKKRSFFVYKDECENPFDKQIDLVEFDPTKYNELSNRTLFDYQVKGVKFMVSRNPAFNWDSMGLGKTTQSIVAVLEQGYKKILVVTLASLKLNWKREIEIYKQDAKIISGSEWDNSPSKFTIINYEILKNFVQIKKSKVKTLSNQLLLENYDCIILDEVHRSRNPSSIQSACIKAICSQPSMKKVIGLSGTPFEKNIDFFNICRVLNAKVSDIVLNSSWYKENIDNHKEYVLRYCNAYEQVLDTPKLKSLKSEILNELPDETKKHKYIKSVLNILSQHGSKTKKIWSIPIKGEVKLVSELTQIDCSNLLKEGYIDNRKKVLVLGRKVGDKKIENTNSVELQQRIKHLQIARKKEEVLHNFPNKFVFPLYFDLSPKDRIQYQDLWTEYLDNKPIKAFTPEELEKISESIKMREFLAKIKVPHTCNFVENKVEDGLNVIIFTHFKEEYESFLKYFGNLAVGINASMTAEKKQLYIDKFQTDPNVKIIVGNIKTLGTGHNLTKGDVVLVNSPDWNSGEHEQGEDRAYRIGRNEDVTVYYTLFEGTHEEEVFERSVQKKENKKVIMES